MYGIVRLAGPVFPQAGLAADAMRLAGSVGLGMIAYVTFLGLLWSFSGRPEGAESYILQRARMLFI